MSEAKFHEAKGHLAFSQALVDKLRQAQMASQTPPEAPAISQEPSQQPVEAPQTSQEAPQQVQSQNTNQEQPSPKNIQETVQELSTTIGAGFDALNKAAETLKETVTTKRKSISKRLKDRFTSKE